MVGAAGGKPQSPVRERWISPPPWIYIQSEEVEACMSSSTTVAGRSVLVTGANRGVGQALVKEAVRRNAKHVYAGTRQPLAHLDDRITYLILDVTNAAQIQEAVERVGSLDILINNAGLALYDKAAALSLTQSLRALLCRRGVTVHAALPGPVDTDMSRGADIPKASPESVAEAILDGVENGDEEIFPDPLSESMAESWRSGAAKALERKYAALVAAEPCTS
jgi:NAD(P)-dependent dehydrogenase (short-subunit alcohol dehydrogenase family)